MEPIHAPKREIRNRNNEDDDGDGRRAIGLVVLIGVLMFGAMILAPRIPILGLSGGEELAGATGLDGIFGSRKIMAEGDLQKAGTVSRDRFAGAVEIVNESDECRSLRTQKEAAEKKLKGNLSATQKKDAQRDVHYFGDRGVAKGCWSGGAG